MPSPFIVTTVSVTDVLRVSPSFVRVTFRGDELADFGTVGAAWDQRIKLIFPPESGVLPAIVGADAWWDAWRTLPEESRGSMRTYSIRDLVGEGDERRLVVDFVLHLVPGATGPASTWAAAAGRGDALLVVGPRRSSTEGGGIEFAPGDADHIVLAGDETAVPAMARILADLPDDASGAAFLEVPESADIDELVAPAGIALHWLPRDGAAVGSRLLPRVVEHLGGRADDARFALELAARTATRDAARGGTSVARGTATRDAARGGTSVAQGTAVVGTMADTDATDREDAAAADEEITDEEIWETPTHPAADGQLPAASPGIPGLYAWIAGESGVVTAIRRHLVRDLGVDRGQVAFMGYWREGVAMRA
ncbi:siderophore-interacting protein [Galbitalea sp. SE-J8]|uniref:siderophore-interacting protein n=1 Tax=Galbitalea sp. SE-J8 TaxID=3054952 RepID=UPI00259CD772|nr:siderophore-interacting protein [Galbitalea sp. SE-J8]MDM4763036.1 siderophore-interacting protein [Galbitalea sp. SE-J8]